MKPSNEQLSKLLELWEKTICPECEGKGKIYGESPIKTFHRQGVGKIIETQCLTCKGTGRRYQIALVDKSMKLDWESLFDQLSGGQTVLSLNDIDFLNKKCESFLSKAGFVKEVME